MSTILLLGRTGQVGWELERSLQSFGDVVTPPRTEADLGRPDTMLALVRRLRPTVVVNAAAYTGVDAAEKDEGAAQRVNADSPAMLARAAAESDAWLVHYSTDYVFDGRGGPYEESAPTAPLNAYGRSKRAGETAIEHSGCRHVILRTSWVYGARGKNFLTTMLRLAREREVLRVVDDQIGAPTWARTIADVTATVLARLAERRFAAQLAGTYHLASRGETSWHGFASAIVDATRDTRTASPRVEPITTEEYPLPAARPKDSRLATGKLTKTFAVHLPEWRDAMRLCLAELKAPRE